MWKKKYIKNSGSRIFIALLLIIALTLSGCISKPRTVTPLPQTIPETLEVVPSNLVLPFCQTTAECKNVIVSQGATEEQANLFIAGVTCNAGTCTIPAKTEVQT